MASNGTANAAVEPQGNNSSTSTDGAPSEIEQETPSFSPEEVAERVYRIFCENLRRERERRGYWE